MTRFQRITMIVILSICVPIICYLSFYLVKDKIERDKRAQQELVADSIAKVENARMRLWVIDSIPTKGRIVTTYAHNVQLPKLCVKIEDTVKPNYKVNDTINFSK